MNRTIAFCAALGILAAGCGSQAIKPPADPLPAQATEEASASAGTMNLIGTEWFLEDLAGAGILDGVRGTIAFPEAGHIAGSGPCNRFNGPCAVGEFTRTGDLARATFTTGPLASTRWICIPAVNYHEQRYLAALQAAEWIEIDGPYLKVYSKGGEKPLRFTLLTQ